MLFSIYQCFVQRIVVRMSYPATAVETYSMRGLGFQTRENKEVVHQQTQPAMSYLYPKDHLDSIWLQ